MSSHGPGSQTGRMASGTTGSSRRWLFLTVASWLYPVVLIASFYATWAIAWGMLGHMPRPSLDDPKYINGWVVVPYNITMLLVIAFPAALVGGVFWTAWSGVQRKLRSLTTASALTLLMALWIAAITFLRVDPLRVGDWFMD